MTEIRCKKCKRLLGKLKLPFTVNNGGIMNMKTLECREDIKEIHGTFETKCGKCSTINEITI